MTSSSSSRSPVNDAVAASTLQLPPGKWSSVLDCLCERFPAISREKWLERFARGRVHDQHGTILAADHPFRVGLLVHYYREVADEAPIPFVESIVYADEDLLVVDKPHFLPVAPTGRHVEHTLLTRLVRRYGNDELVPLHRIDRETAGLVLFSVRRATRSRYQSLFRERLIVKHYEALAPPLVASRFPIVRRTRIVAGDPFPLMREVEGEPNSATRIDVIDRGEEIWRYALDALTGRKHQLRVHMAALGAALLNDHYYPALRHAPDDAFGHPLKLLARSLCFDDPIDGRRRRFESLLRL
ncbi:MAG: pseudouridine synthase [Dokdonella sp.]